MTRDRTAPARWAAVAALVLGVVLVPMAVRARPATESDLSAPELLHRVQASASEPWSGYVDTFGAIQLPVTKGDFGDLGALLGEHTRMRAWWRGDDDWRVDRLTAVGETDLYHRGYGTDGVPVTTEWDYERARATVDHDPDIRLPRSVDVVPPVLGRIVTAGVGDDEVTRLDARRVAGRSAAGLRISPRAPQASIDHIDLWADPDSGLPLLLEVYDAPPGDHPDPVFTSRFRAFSDDRPDDSVTRFDPPDGVDVRLDRTLDIADAANQYARITARSGFAGLPRAAVADRAVGVYGSGPTQVVTIPLRGKEAGPLREQLLAAPGAKRFRDVLDLPGDVSFAGSARRLPRIDSVLVTVGPLSVLLTGDDGGMLLAGTVTPQTLRQGARALQLDTLRLEDE